MDRIRRTVSPAQVTMDKPNELLPVHFTPGLPRFTLVLQGILRYSSRLNRLVTDLSKVRGIEKVVPSCAYGHLPLIADRRIVANSARTTAGSRRFPDDRALEDC